MIMMKRLMMILMILMIRAITSQKESCLSEFLPLAEMLKYLEMKEEDYSIFMIELFVFSLYFWSWYWTYLSSTFDPLGSFSRTATLFSNDWGSFGGAGGQWHRVKDQHKGQKERLLLDWLTRYKVDNSIQPVSFSRGKKFGIWYVSMTSELVDKYWGLDQSWDSIEGASYFYAQLD